MTSPPDPVAAPGVVSAIRRVLAVCAPGARISASAMMESEASRPFPVWRVWRVGRAAGRMSIERLRPDPLDRYRRRQSRPLIEGPGTHAEDRLRGPTRHDRRGTHPFAGRGPRGAGRVVPAHSEG